MAVETPVCDFGRAAPNFKLPGVDGRIWSLEECKGERGLLVVFMCNHCPYVQAIHERLVRDARELESLGIRTVGINSNDAVQYPADSFENMRKTAEEWALPFPYLFDETQEVARTYDAVCTPDFFGYDASLGLQYRGRLDASGRNPAPQGAARELFDAMSTVADTGVGPAAQVSSMGCSIKWKS